MQPLHLERFLELVRQSFLAQSQVEAMEAEMAQELQREAEARSAAPDEAMEGGTAVQEAGPSLLLDEAGGGKAGGDGQR